MLAPDTANEFGEMDAETLANARWNLTNAPETDSVELERRRLDRLEQIDEEQTRRATLATVVELYERLCVITSGETQGEYTHSTRYLSPEEKGRSVGNVSRMPDAVEIEALVLSDGEETAYPVHGEFVDGERFENRNPWSYDDRLYPIELTLISCGDYHGSSWDAANNRALKGHPGVSYREPNSGGMGSVFNVTTLMVGNLSTFANAQGNERPEDFVDVAIEWLTGLVSTLENIKYDYPLIDDDIHSAYETELADEAWDAYLESDVFDKLSNLAPDEIAEESVDSMRAADESTQEVRTAYYEFEDNEWSCESATSIVNGRHDDAVKHVARTVFGWDV